MVAVKRKPYTPYTTADLERLVDLRDMKKLSWSVVAERMGRSYHSARGAYIYAKSSKGRRQRIEAREAMLVECLEAGLDIPEIAENLGVTPSAVYKSLSAHGFDSETRALYAREGGGSSP